MIKIKLTESRTLPVSGDLLDFLKDFYQNKFIEIIKAALQEQVQDIKATIADKEADRLSINKNKAALKTAENILKVLGDNESADSKKASQTLNKLQRDVSRRVEVTPQNAEGVNVGEIESDVLVDYILKSPIKDTLIKGRLNDEQIREKIQAFFKKRKIDKVRLNIELVRKGEPNKDYSGLYSAGHVTIVITADASLFVPTKSGRAIVPSIISVDNLAAGHKKVVDGIQIATETLTRSIRHELQHLTADLFDNIIGVKGKVGLPKHGTYGRDLDIKYDRYGRALDNKGKVMYDEQGDPVMYIDPRTGEPIEHHLLPVEAPTNVEDAIDDFKVAFDKYIVPKFADKPQDPKLKSIINFLLRKFIGSDIEPPPDIKQIIGNNIIYFDNVFFRKIKTENPRLWKWAASRLIDKLSV